MVDVTTEERFIGVDFHKQTLVVARLRRDGSRCEKTQTYPSTPEGLRSFRESCTASDHVAVEATYHWAMFADVFEDFEGELVLAHPLANRIIAESRNKCDKVDAKVLADLLRTNFLARAWIAPPPVREARELLRHRAGLTRILTMLKNRIRVLLAKAGQKVDAYDLFGPAGLKELNAVSLSDERRRIVQGYIDLAKTIANVVKEADQSIQERVKLCPDAQRIDAIRGFGPFSALTVMAEIGSIQRFSRAAKLVSYAGLAPTNRSSAGQVRHGRITKQGSPWLRWILLEAALQAIRAYPELDALCQRVASHQGGRQNAGRIAVARQLLVSIYHVLKTKQAFDPKRIGRRSGGGVASKKVQS